LAINKERIAISLVPKFMIASKNREKPKEDKEGFKPELGQGK